MIDTASLPYNAPLEEYQQQADALLAALESGDEAAEWRVKWEHPDFHGKSVSDVRAARLDITDARAVTAREYGFETWADLAEFTDLVKRDHTVDRFEGAVEAVVSGDVARLASLLDAHPELVQARSTRRHHATLLHYLGANGVEGGRQKTPPNAVEVTKLLLDAGAQVDALADLYDGKCTTMSLLVSSAHPAEAGLQAELAETLLDYGTELDGRGFSGQSALMTALTFGYLDTARALAKRGATVDTFPAAAGLGRVEAVTEMLPRADSMEKHVALALAAQLGHAEVVRLLLEAGEDPNRYNPDGVHAHSTPLHQAALADHAEVVRVLVNGGARLDMRDKVYGGTPLGWAVHGNRKRIAEYLGSLGAGET